MEEGRCPECGQSDYIVMWIESTALYCPTRIINGVVSTEGDRNIITYKCRCMNCGKDFEFSPNKNKYGDVEDGYNS